MNKYTNKRDFRQTADFIRDNSDLIRRRDCKIIDDILYERLGEDHYRFFFDVDDYDYVVDADVIAKLNKIFK